ncbi:MAG TPA: response regulator [Thermoanaerobaculia bacterium]|nr:response regulator [Thermoanaerobaculia bacterium]
MAPAEEIRILVVDDDAGIRRLLTLLCKRRGWDVVARADGDHVVEEIASMKPDVVVLDLMMPRVSGFEVLQRLEAENPACLKRVIVLTAVSTSTLGGLTCESALWAVVRKPFDNTGFIAIVEECLQAQQNASGSAASVLRSESAP